MKPFNFLNCESLFLIGVLFTISLMQACDSEPPTDLAKADLIPKPVSVVSTGQGFSLLANSIIYVEGANNELTEVANYLSTELSIVTEFANKVESISGTPGDGNFYLVAAGADELLGTEGYELTITKDLVSIKANKPEGVFRGVQTLMQILPVGPKEKSENPKINAWRLATGTIRDYPSYSWRGSMLDVARHFFGVEDVKRYIDLISYYKMNVLHLGLSNDQGWRIEIKSWPNLALHGGSTQVGGGKGGYYTQEQYKDIVAYAASRYVTIVPEIDLPGHINAALASYGELNGGTMVPEEGKYK